jgi:Zn-dependent membrane protease YugP
MEDTMPGYGLSFDPMYFVFLLPALLLTLYAQWRVQAAYNKWSQVRNSHNATGADVAQVLLPRENLQHVGVEVVPGQLTDHYDPSKDVLRLSNMVAQQPSIAAMAVAAHEIGHAEQDREGYVWMKIRAGIVPFVNIGASLGYLIFFGGLFAQVPAIAWLGVLMVAAGAIFALVTLPVELNASSRGMRMLTEYGLISNEEERRAARDMLNSAALTYVAGAAQAVATILYYVFLLMGMSGRRDDRR